jgi:hypothetical protein
MTNDEIQTQLRHNLERFSEREVLENTIKQDDLFARNVQLGHARWIAWENAWDRQKEAENKYAYAQAEYMIHPCYFHFNCVLNAERSMLERAESVRRAEHALCVSCKGNDLREFCRKQLATIECWGLDSAMEEILREQSYYAWTDRYFSGMHTTGITYPRPVPLAPAPPLDINSGRLRFPAMLPAAGVDEAKGKECVVEFGVL